MQIQNFNCMNIGNYTPCSSKFNSLATNKNDTFTLSFTGLKKSDFQGVELAAVERFKAPVQNFKTKENFNVWAKNKIENDYLNKDYSARTPEITAQRKAMIDDWHNYLTQDGSMYSKNPAWELLIMASITKDLKSGSNKIPPVLNAGALAATVSRMQELYSEKPGVQLNFSKIYNEKLQEMYTFLEEESSDNSSPEKGVWIKIPSKEHDAEHFSENVDKLKALSHPCWCTKSTNAEPYLSEGDFHIYMTDGKPKVGIRFKGDSIEEIQGPRNNSMIPVLYAREIENYTRENLYKGKEEEIQNAVRGEEKFEKIKQELADAIENKDFVTILNHPAFNCGAKKTENEHLEIERYIPHNIPFSLSDLGIKEDELFDNIEKINSAVDLIGCDVTRFKNLKEVKGNLSLTFSRVQGTGSLEKVGGDFDFDSQKTSIDENLVRIDGEINDTGGEYDSYDKDTILLYNRFKKAKNKREVLDILGFKTKTLPDGSYSISGYTEEERSNYCALKEFYGDVPEVKNMTEDDLLSDVTVVRGDVHLSGSELKSLGKISKIGGNLTVSTSELEDFGELEYVRGDVNCENSKIETLGKIKRIDGNLRARNSLLKSLSNLRLVKGNVDIGGTRVLQTMYLKEVGGDLIMDNTNIKRIDKPLKSVGGHIYTDSYTAELLDEQFWERGLWEKVKLTN